MAGAAANQAVRACAAGPRNGFSRRTPTVSVLVEPKAFNKVSVSSGHHLGTPAPAATPGPQEQGTITRAVVAGEQQHLRRLEHRRAFLVHHHALARLGRVAQQGFQRCFLACIVPAVEPMPFTDHRKEVTDCVEG